MKKVLIVEDDENILELEKDYLEANGFETETALDGNKGLELALSQNFDLVVLDLMLPKTDGYEVCRRLRLEKETPVIIVSAKKEDFDKIKAFGIGADDYMVKPFSPSELVARVNAHIKRYERLTNADEQDVIEFEKLRIDKLSRRVYVNDKEIIFTNKEFELLTFLAENRNIVFSKDDLFQKIWQYESIGETSTITVHINRIRDKLKEADEEADYVQTVWGSGYRFKG